MTIPHIDFLLIICLLGQPSYKDRVQAEHDITVSKATYSHLKWCNKLSGDPEVKMRLKRIAKIKWDSENEEKYQELTELRDEHFKEDWSE